jgi:hypothetical protein
MASEFQNSSGASQNPQLLSTEPNLTISRAGQTHAPTDRVIGPRVREHFAVGTQLRGATAYKGGKKRTVFHAQQS